MGHYDFEKDLKQSNKATKILARLLESDGFKIIDVCDDGRYDLIIENSDKSTRKIEFKCDLKALETGNLAIEKESRGKPSGITTSEADFFIYQIGRKYYAFETELMREHLLKSHYSIVKGGDKGTSLCYLIPVLTFKKINFVTQILKEWELQK